MVELAGNVLYYGDNLDVLGRHVEDESVDLVYLDPPFNSNASYNVFFGHADGTQAAAQIKAFDDTWHWDSAAAAAFEAAVTGGGQVAQALAGFRTLLGPSTMLAYLSDDGAPACGASARTQAHGLAISALRPYGEPLPQAAYGRRVRPRELPQRDRLEAQQRPLRHDAGARRSTVISTT